MAKLSHTKNSSGLSSKTQQSESNGKSSLSSSSTHAKETISSSGAHRFFGGDSLSFSLMFWTVGVAIAACVGVVIMSADIVFLFVTAIILSFAFEGLIAKLAKYVGRPVSIIVIYVLLTLFLLVGFVLVVPLFVGTISGLLNQFVLWSVDAREIIATDGLSGLISSIQWLPSVVSTALLEQVQNSGWEQDLVVFLQKNLTSMISFSQQLVSQMGGVVVTLLTSFATILTNISLLLFMTILSSWEYLSLRSLVQRFWPEWMRDDASTFLATMTSKLGSRLQGQVIICLFMAVMMFVVYLGMDIAGFGVDNYGSLALLAGLMEIFPYIGAMTAAIPAVLIATISVGWGGGLFVMISIIIVQQLQANIITPLVMNKAAGVNPLLTFLTMIIAGLTMGFLGLVIAVPLSIVITVLYEQRQSFSHRRDPDEIVSE